MNVYDTLARAARQWPERPALIDAAGALTYRELWSEIEALRVHLDRLGVRPGHGVGVQARNGRAFVVAALAALGCGGVIMPIHHLIKADELAHMLARAPLCAIIDDGHANAQIHQTAVELPLPGGTTVRFRQQAEPLVPLAPKLENAAFVRFTSGTTGAAKGVVLTHQAVLERTRAANSGLGLTCEDRVLWVLPMSYHFAATILLYLEVGAATVVSADYLAESILDAAIQHQASFLYITAMHVRMLTAEGSGRTLPPSLQRVMSVSSPLAPQAARDFQARHRLPVSQGYGIIEVGLPIMNLADAADHPEAVGYPLRGFEAAILDEHLQPAATAPCGQLGLRGPGMFAGYLHPYTTREEAMPHGWFLTGDLAHRDVAGRIVIDGRLKTVIDVAGHKVFPEEIAAVVDQHPAVLRSRITTRKHPQFGEVVHAEVQLRRDHPNASVKEILAFCRERLSSHKVPATFELVAELNLTASGKVRHA